MMKWRLGAVGGAALCAVAAWEASHLAGGPWRTPLTAAAFLSALLAAVVFAGLSVMGNRQWSMLNSYLDALGELSRRSPVVDDRRAGLWMMFAGFATYVVLVVICLPRQIPPQGNDQGAYLVLAREIDARGGLLHCLSDLFQGRFAEANRHPLYPLLLSYTPTYESGKRLSAMLGGITLCTLTTLIRRKLGYLVAGLFCVLLATNRAFLYFSTLVACEILLLLLAGVAWLLCVSYGNVRQKSQPDGEATSQRDQRREMVPLALQAAGLGVVYGLMYLTKAHAVLFLAGFVLWIVVRQRRRMLEGKLLLTAGLPFLVGFIVVASPLLVRNVVRYGQPLFNVNGYLLFEDQYSNPVQLAERKTLSQSAAEYWRTHSLREIAGRAVKGLAWETFIMLRSLGPAPWDDARVLFGLLVFVSALAALVLEPRADAALAMIWGLILWLFFAWYLPIAAGERFILPILPPALAYCALGVTRLNAMTYPDGSSMGRTRWMVGASVTWCLVTVVLTYFLYSTTS